MFYYPPPSPPPPISYFSLLRAEKTIEAVDRENAILSRQVCDLARENVDLRTKIIKMSTERAIESKNGISHIGYARQAIKAKQEQAKYQRKEDDRMVRTEVKKGQLGRAYSFGQLNRNQTEAKQRKTYNSAEKNRTEIVQPRTAPKQYQQKRFNYLPPEEPREQPRKAQQRSTIIQRLNQFTRHQQNPEHNNRPILRIESQAYNEPVPPKKSHNEVPQHTGKKDNKVYLQEGQSGTYSPISKLKTIKKLTQVEPERESVIQSRRTMGKKQYLSLIGDVFSKTRGDNTNIKKTTSIAEQGRQKENKQEN